MHFLKTRLEHILYHNFTDKEFSRFMKIRAITCQLKAIPNDKQIASVCPQKTYESIVKALANEGKSIAEVLAKDIEDAREVEEKRSYWKRKKRQQRGKNEDVQGDGLGHSEKEIRVDKIRVDKIREDNIYIGGDVTSIINYYNKQFNSNYSLFITDQKYGNLELNIKKALESYSQEDIFKAIDNFKKDPFFKEKKLHRPILLFKDLSTIDKYLNSTQGSWKDKIREEDNE